MQRTVTKVQKILKMKIHKELPHLLLLVITCIQSPKCPLCHLKREDNSKNLINQAASLGIVSR